MWASAWLRRKREEVTTWIEKITHLRDAINYGLIAGVISLSISVIGMVALFAERDLIAGVLTLGQVFLFAPTAVLAYLAARKVPE